MDDKEFFMREALTEARKAFEKDEVPVGAIILKEGKIIARAHNLKENKGDATRHAEMECISEATQVIGNWWLEDCDIYVTMEPCPMCAGALINSRIRKLYYGAKDPKSGCCGSVVDLCSPGLFNHNIEVEGGVLEKECGDILSEFFRKKRKQKDGK